MNSLLHKIDTHLPFNKTERIIIAIVLLLHALPALEFLHLSSQSKPLDEERVPVNFVSPEAPKAPAAPVAPKAPPPKPKEEPKKKVVEEKTSTQPAPKQSAEKQAPQTQASKSEPQAQSAAVAPSTNGSGSGTPIFTDIGKLEILYAPDAEGYYPSFSRRACEQGSVDIRLMINQSGEVDEVIMVKSSTYPQLDRAAAQIAQRYRFKPFMLNGAPARTNTLLKVSFTLKGCQ
jgi:periplasmic protein TonB